MSDEISNFYGHNVVGFDRVSGFTRDVTLIVIEVPNERLEQVLTRDQLDGLHRRFEGPAHKLPYVGP